MRIREIVKDYISDEWDTPRAHYISFIDNKYCVSYNSFNSYVFTDSEDNMIYMGFNENRCIKKIKEILEYENNKQA